MADLPEPPVPADCDLQDFPFMPLHVARLRDSDLASEEKPESCWYAVLLWAASWHQLPAGSLPDSDAILTKLIGLGRDVRTFAKHKAGAMRGFEKCSDGRLYHPVVAEQALAAWRSKLRQRWQTECARIKKANQRNGTDRASPTFEEFCAGTSPGTADNVPRDNGECPQGNGLQETGTGIGIEEEDANASLSPDGDDAGRVGSKYPVDFESAWVAYPHVKGRSSKSRTLAAWRRLSPSVRKALSDAGDRYGREGREPNEDCGAPSMERWLREERFVDWLTAETPPELAAWIGPPEVRTALLAEPNGERLAAFLDRCGWVNGPDRLVTSSNGFVIDTLRQEAGAALARLKVKAKHVPQDQSA